MLGRTLLDGAKRVRISGRTISVQARFRTIGSYTGHAAQAELVGWIEDRRPIAGSLFLTHGEERSVEALASKLTPLGIARSIITPEIGDCYQLGHAGPAILVGSARDENSEAIGPDWRNMCASLLANRSEAHTSELQSLLRISYAVCC